MKWSPFLITCFPSMTYLHIHQLDPSLPFVNFFFPTIPTFIHSKYFQVQLLLWTTVNMNYKYSNTSKYSDKYVSPT